MADVSTPVAQPVGGLLTRAAIFLVMTVNPGPEASTAVRSLCGDLAALLRAVGFRDLGGRLSCILGMDLCFELATQIMAKLEHAVAPVDEVHGFRFFDARDLLGFVDGTENPTGQAVVDATLIGAEDPSFAGGSYVIVQKYLHDMAGWNALPTEAQERIIGRTKLSDIELDETVKPSWAHSALTVIEEGGKEIKILRDNMPFGQVGQGEFGTYFIGYSRSPRTIEQMLENMFVGRPPGNYDRILDFSRAVTGNLFFVPSATFLEEVTPDAQPLAAEPLAASPAAEPSQSISPMPDGSLGIGSLKGNPR